MVIADSLLGVLILARPDDRRLRTLEARISPVLARGWAEGLDTLLTRESIDLTLLVADEGSVVAVRRSPLADPELIFQPLNRTPYSTPLPMESLRDFAAAVGRAGAQARPTDTTPIIQPDPDGAIYWLLDSEAETLHPSPVNIPKPEYPRAFQMRAESGVAWLRYVIEINGEVSARSIQVLWASHPAFARSAVAAISKGRWRPGRFRGIVVRTGIVQAVSFTIGS